jgi:transcription antitermination factor NusG
VSNIVRFGMELAILSNDTCAQIMAFAAAQQEGGVNAMLEIQGIRPGQKVIVKDGPFVGLEGLVSALAKDRVLVLMSLLGKEQTMKFNPADLSLA